MILASARTEIADYLSTVIYVYTLVSSSTSSSTCCSRPASARRTRGRATACWASCATSASRSCASSGGWPRASAASTSARCWRSSACTSSTSLSSRASSTANAWLRAAAVLVCVVAIDQLTKHAVERSIVPGEEHGFLPGIQLVDTHNRGVAFGFFPGNHLAVTILVSLALVVLLAYFALHAGRALMWLPTGMIAGGAIGNVARPPAPRVGHRLRQAAARLAAVQPRRRVDHARHRRPLRPHRPRPPPRARAPARA